MPDKNVASIQASYFSCKLEEQKGRRHFGHLGPLGHQVKQNAPPHSLHFRALWNTVHVAREELAKVRSRGLGCFLSTLSAINCHLCSGSRILPTMYRFCMSLLISPLQGNVAHVCICRRVKAFQNFSDAYRHFQVIYTAGIRYSRPKTFFHRSHPFHYACVTK